MQAAARKLINAVLIALIAVLAACGGGGGGGSSSPAATPTPTSTPTPVTTLSGYVVKGPVRGGTVRLYSVATNGAKTLLASVLSGTDGSFLFTASPATGTVLLAEVGDGTYTDEMTVQATGLNTPLRAVAVWTGTKAPLSISIFTEMAVRILANANPQSWTAASVNAANDELNTTIGAANQLDFKPADLRISQDFSALRDDDFGMSLLSGGFSAFMPRANLAANTTGLGGGLDALYQLFVNDGADDRYRDKFILGMADFIDVTALSADIKNRYKSYYLLGVDSGSPSLANAKPTGQATGSTTAPMPDDGFLMVPQSGQNFQAPLRTGFNKRGALVGYQLTPGGSAYRLLYSASVGELYGDGDVGIGRWHGGVVHDGTVSGGKLTNVVPQIWASGGWAYAVAKQVSNLPTCGNRILSLVGTTLMTQIPNGTASQPQELKLTPDSKMALSFAPSGAYVGLDIGMLMRDGSIVRYQSPGGVTFPASSGILLDSRGYAQLGVVPQSTGGYNLTIRVLAAGAGATSMVAKFFLGSTFIQSEMPSLAAAFRGTNTLDLGGCANSSGGNISPASAPGFYQVLTGGFSGDAATDVGSPGYTTFGARGQLATQSLNQSSFQQNFFYLNISESTPTFDLAGNADAFVGRINGLYTGLNISKNGLVPYAVGRPPTVIPATGTRHYVLQNATTVWLRVINYPSPILYQGTVSSATLDVNFGEYPLGTLNAAFGSARLAVNGDINSVSFGLRSVQALPSDLATGADGVLSRASSGRLFFQLHPGTQGALAGTNAEYAVIRFSTQLPGGAEAIGALVLKQQ